MSLCSTLSVKAAGRARHAWRQRKQVMTFKSVIGMAGFDFGPCEHELEL